ncbi:MAG: alkaline phosphatase family protein [Anaerolineae bacterium]
MEGERQEDRPRLLVVGLDGATFDLIRPWARADRLPTMARLLEEGVSAPLRSVPNMNSAPAWSSFATGLNPGKHGIFYFDERIPGTYAKRYLNGSFRHGAPFWRLLSQAGYRVGIINVPMTYPAEEVNGYMLAGLDTPAPGSPAFSYPRGLAAELKARVGDYIIEPGVPGYIKAGRRDRARARIFEALEKRLAYALHLAQTFPTDVMVVVFTATDAAQHFFWKDMDPSHPEHDPAEAATYGDTILRVYQRLDQAVAQLMEAMPGARVMLVSDHGGGFNQRGAEFLNPWLAAQGLLRLATPGAGARGSLGARARGAALETLRWGYGLVDRHFTRETKQKLALLLPGLRGRVEGSLIFQGVDWPATRAYAFGARDDLWVNLRGREPLGAVEPGEEYEVLRNLLLDRLRATLDWAREEPVVEWAARREDVYAGPFVERAPDILLQWRTEFVLSGLYLPQPDKPKPPAPAPKPNLNNGGHRPHGIFVMAGEGIRRGVALPEAHIVDVAPTILHLFGVPVPQDADGRVLREVWAPEGEPGQREEQRAGPAGPEAPSRADYSEEEARLVEERLRGLGYVE